MAPLTPHIKAASKTKEKEDIGQNIQVFVRSRPLNKAEKDKKAFSIVDFPSIKQIDVKEKLHSSHTKSYQFDRVFGPKSQQIDVYKAVVEPLIDQVMMGYNCTVFAYGQTGTGKTFTMEGGSGRDEVGVTWETDSTAGIIPRALAQILDSLKEQPDNVEYSVKISFLELYNEEIFDLLSSVDDTSKLRLFDDPYKKGSVIIQGLEEVQVHTKAQVYKILEKGSDKRKTAETLMNAHSSRSHTVFSVTVHIKEALLEQEVLRIGKLNLVDLAGSENIGRSGAKDGRAREAGNINQSLLTLGRVITNLVERAPHIPYRESKLTRLLQDSLGGRTKTSIIATVSPATINLEETLSTLDYAYRARSILNRPEINARLSKEDLVKEYSNEMDRLKRDCLQLREKSGVWIAQENYDEMLDKIQQNQVKIHETTKEMRALYEEMEKKKKLFDEVEKNMIYKSREIQKVRDQLEIQEAKLTEVSTDLKKVEREKAEQEHLVTKHQETELKLGIQAKKLLVGCDDMDDDLTKLHNKLDTVRKMDTDNEEAKILFKDTFEEVVNGLHVKIEKFGNQYEQCCEAMKEDLKVELTTRSHQIKDLVVEIESLLVKNEEIERRANEEAQNFLSQSGDVHGKVGQRYSQLTDVEKQRGECFVKEIMPSLKNISNKIDQHAKALAQFKLNVVNNFEIVKAKVNNHIKNIISIVKETGSFVNDHFTIEKNEVDKMRGLNDQILQSHQTMKTSLKSVETVYTEHFAVVDSLSSNVDTVLSEIAKKVSPIKKRIDINLSKVSEAVESLKKDVTESLKENQEETRKSLDECQDITEDIVESTKNLKVNSSTYIQESLANTEEVFTKVDESLTKHDVEVSKAKEEVKSSTIRSRDIISASKTTLNAKLDMKQETKLNDNVENIVSLSKTNVDDMKENVTEMQAKMTNLMEDGINIYQPSGETPVRVERQFPRYLAATSPHARIKERFRKTVEAKESAQPSVDESVDNTDPDSFLTPNTTGDMENTREMTGSFSSGVSTSDYASMSSLSKREIKKPKTINKNILGSSNTVNKS